MGLKAATGGASALVIGVCCRVMDVESSFDSSAGYAVQEAGAVDGRGVMGRALVLPQYGLPDKKVFPFIPRESTSSDDL